MLRVAAALGEAFAHSYARLWDEDEAMMQRRERLAGLALMAPPGALDLGPVEGVQARAPFTTSWGELPVRIDQVDGALIAFPAVCPHWLGPLDETPVENGCVCCPWHDYRFDLRTGESADGRGLKLKPLLTLAVENGRAMVRAREPAHG